MRETLWLAAAGLAVGFPAMFITRRWLGSVLFGVAASDPGAVAASLAILIGVAAVAGFLPARRAMRVAPLTAPDGVTTKRAVVT